MDITPGQAARNAQLERRLQAKIRDSDYSPDPYDGLHRIAVQGCARTASKASYPSSYLELNGQLNDSAGARDFRRIIPFDADKARRKMAEGIPYAELTDPENGSVVDYDGRYKLNKAA